MPFDSPFNALRNQFRSPRLTLVETKSTDATSGTLAVGQFRFNASNYPAGTDFRLLTTFHVSSGPLVGTVLLYNVTDAEVVTNSTFTTSLTAPDSQVGSLLSVGAAAGDLQTSTKTYEVRISVTGALPVDIVTVGSVSMLVD